MLIKKPQDITSSELTDHQTYVNRRTFMRAGILAASVAATCFAYRKLNRAGRGRAVDRPRLAGLNTSTQPTTGPAAATDPAIAKAFRVDEPLTPLRDITHYNNF